MIHFTLSKTVQIRNVNLKFTKNRTVTNNNTGEKTYVKHFEIDQDE